MEAENENMELVADSGIVFFMGQASLLSFSRFLCDLY